MPQICFVLCYIGPLPRYFSTFLATCAQNDDVDFLIASDQPVPSGLGDNVRWVPATLGSLRDRFSKAAGFPVALTSGYKICDYKPVLGQAFARELEDYDFWGFCDPDLVWGHIRSFATEERLAAHDVLTFRGRDFISGPCTLLRNEPRINGLYAESPTLREAFEDPDTVSFTERTGRVPYSAVAIEDLVATGRLVNFSDVVHREVHQGRLRWLDVSEICERSANRHRLLFEWRRGHLYWLIDGDRMWGGEGREILFYHYVGAKNDAWFYISDRAELPPVFQITQRGPFTPPANRPVDRLSFEAQRFVSGLPRFGRGLYRRVSSKLSRTFGVSA